MDFYDKNTVENKAQGSKKIPLKTIMIGGTESVNKNMTVYEYGDEIIVVDCGIGFPDVFDMPGVDVLIPDFDYLIENSHKIKVSWLESF